MKKPLTLIVAQLNFSVAHIEHNQQLIIDAITTAKQIHKADLIVFPELALSGYPPEDWLLRSEFLKKIDTALQNIATYANGIDVLLGYPQQKNHHIYNAAVWLRNGQIIANYQKQRLPNYGVFDENRYFSPGQKSCVVDCQGVAVGVLICEDIWYKEPAVAAVADGAQLLICLNASPFHAGKHEERTHFILQRIAECQTPIVYAHQIGGQDELVFDGGSLLFNGQGQLCQRAPSFQTALIPMRFTINGGVFPQMGEIAKALDEVESIYQALVLGVHDYVHKNGFSGVLIGLSGGVDSALTAAIAVDALGTDAVQAVLMPSRYTQDMSLEDAISQAKQMGIEYLELPIEPAFTAFLSILAKPFENNLQAITQENLQARCRGTLLMALSNQTGKLVLTTSNKSELALGYSTLYGDMAGGFDVLKDVSKTMVYALARYRNRQQPIIPERVLTRPPSAELAPNQKDEDTLPPYAILDQVLTDYIEKSYNQDQLLAAGFPKEQVEFIIHRLHQNEYKRRQSPPGVRVTSLAFGRDWRYPITGSKHE